MQLWYQLQIEQVQSTRSTNILAEQWGQQHPKQPALFIAKEQTAGRGRYGRSFFSQIEHGLYGSYFIPLRYLGQLPPHLMTLLVAVSIAEATEHLTKKHIQLKWVNDLFLDYRKIGGILCETVFSSAKGKLIGIVIGIGINLAGTLTDTDSAIQQVAGTLFGQDLPANWHLSHYLQLITERFEYHLTQPQANWLADYEHYLLGRGQLITYESDNTTKQGVIHGIDQNGQLVVLDEQGQPHSLINQSVSLGSHRFAK